jgi:hypothetical protein
MCYRLDDVGFESQQWPDIFLISNISRLALGSTRLLFNGYGGIKQLGYEADHSFLFNAKIKNEWCSTSTPVCLHGMYKENLTFIGIQIYKLQERTHLLIL